MNGMALVLGLAAAPLLGLSAPALAQVAEGHITVTGQGRVAMAPDMATISLGVVTEGASAAEALGANSEALAALLAQLTEAGVAERDVQTSGLSLGPRYADPRPGEEEAGPRIAAYVAQNMVTVRVRDLAALGEMLDAAVQSGANSLNGLSFGLQDPTTAEDEARRAAMAEARRRAGLYAAAEGLTAGPVVSISETGVPQVPMMAEMRAASSFKGVPTAAGEIEVQVEVTVVYELAD